MVTSNKLSDKKVVKMADHEHNNIAVVPQRTLLGEVNEHITCPLCRGYYIDATTIVECLHSFCRSCIIKHLQVKSYCPVCEMMINSAKPNIKLDKALQDIVYKLVPGLFQKEMERRQQFYASRPGTAASATPEQRGEDTERIIFSPEDVISFSLEYADLTDADSISSKSSDSNESQSSPASTRRFLQCPAVVNINHLKKFLSMKFDIDSTQFAIDILYKRVPLPDYYTLMDIAYIFNWKRNEPMRFFYQIIDYVAIRNRLFDINRKSSHYRDRKSSPASTEDTNVSSPAPHLNDQGSEASSGTDSPMPDDSTKHTSDTLNKIDKLGPENKTILEKSSSSHMSPKKTDEDVEKSQFLNSFELTAKTNCMPIKSSPSKSNIIIEDKPKPVTESTQIMQINLIEKLPKVEEKCADSLKRKSQASTGTPELKKLKLELEKSKISNYIHNPSAQQSSPNQSENSKTENSVAEKKTDGLAKGPQVPPLPSNNSSSPISKDLKQQPQISTIKQVTENPVLKRVVTAPPNTSSPKRKLPNDMTTPPSQIASMLPKAVSPLKLHIPKESQSDNAISKTVEIPKPLLKKMPDLKPSGLTSQTQVKSPTVNKVRMDLLANNSDPTIDRSKILSQVKSSLSAQSAGQTSGDPLKSLFDSCKINIPSSLSITLTDQKLENRSPGDPSNVEVKKNIVNKNIAGTSNISSHKVPSPPVHNYIEILKLPDTDPKKHTKSDNASDTKSNSQNKLEGTAPQSKFLNKSSESSAKGPIPNLKPIADTKLGKQSGSFVAPITFQQTFEQQLQSMQCDKKTKLPKNKTQVPKLVPATPKSLSAVTKSSHPINKPVLGTTSTTENKISAALDLSTPHNIQTQIGSQQTYDKALETMQSIANLAKKQNLPSKGLSLSMPHNNVYPSVCNRPMATGVGPLRLPSTSNMNQMKADKINALASQSSNNRQDTQSKTNQMKLTNSGSPTMSPLNYPIGSHASASTAQPSPRSQTRSPSSSPKLVIAEEKQSVNSQTDHNMSQSNQITSTQLPNLILPKSESPKASPGPSKPSLKPVKPLTSGKVAGIWQPLTPTMKTNPTMSSPSDFLSQQLARQMEVNAWIKAHRQYEYIKNMSNITHQTDNNFNNQDKQ